MKPAALRNLVLAAILVVALLLAWSYWTTRRRVRDASNDPQLSHLFDQLNPGVAGT